MMRTTIGKTLTTGGDDRTAIVWDVPSRRAKRTLKGHDLAITSLPFTPCGLTLATGSGNASVVFERHDRKTRVLR